MLQAIHVRVHLPVQVAVRAGRAQAGDTEVALSEESLGALTPTERAELADALVQTKTLGLIGMGTVPLHSLRTPDGGAAVLQLRSADITPGAIVAALRERLIELRAAAAEREAARRRAVEEREVLLRYIAERAKSSPAWADVALVANADYDPMAAGAQQLAEELRAAVVAKVGDRQVTLFVQGSEECNAWTWSERRAPRPDAVKLAAVIRQAVQGAITPILPFSSGWLPEAGAAVTLPNVMRMWRRGKSEGADARTVVALELEWAGTASRWLVVDAE